MMGKKKSPKEYKIDLIKNEITMNVVEHFQIPKTIPTIEDEDQLLGLYDFIGYASLSNNFMKQIQFSLNYDLTCSLIVIKFIGVLIPQIIINLINNINNDLKSVDKSEIPYFIFNIFGFENIPYAWCNIDHINFLNEATNMCFLIENSNQNKYLEFKYCGTLDRSS